MFLIGYMASGKTTLGKALASRLGKTFIDLDEFIEKKAAMTVKDFFALHGEHEFRKLEKKSLHEAADIPNAIIACGGGTPCFFDNIDFINQRGNSIFLEASIDVLLRRLLDGNASRPLVAGKTPQQIKATIEQHLQQRLPFYRRAKISFNSDSLESLEQINESVEKLIKAYPFVFSKPFI